MAFAAPQALAPLSGSLPSVGLDLDVPVLLKKLLVEDYEKVRAAGVMIKAHCAHQLPCCSGRRCARSDD